MGVSQVIDALKRAFPPGQIALKGTDLYSELNGSYLSDLESEITPACIFRPQNNQEVSTFLQVIRPFATKGKATFAIKSSGQQPTPGCANIQDGITLDLGLLKGIKLCKNGLVEIGAGERWGAVYDKLESKGLGVSGDRSGKGGMGGLPLQGTVSPPTLGRSFEYRAHDTTRWSVILLFPRRFRLRQCREL
jgi:hypothetical protein